MAADYYPARGGGATDVIRLVILLEALKHFPHFYPAHRELK